METKKNEEKPAEAVDGDDDGQVESHRLGAQIVDGPESQVLDNDSPSTEVEEGFAFDIIVVEGPDQKLYQNSDFLVSFPNNKQTSSSFWGSKKKPADTTTTTRIVLKAGDAWFRIHPSSNTTTNGNSDERNHKEEEEEGSMEALRSILQLGKTPIVYYLLEEEDDDGTSKPPRVIGAAKANIFLWKYTDSIVVSDIDGTITKSNVQGAVGTLLTNQYELVSHDGICQLLQQFLEAATTSSQQQASSAASGSRRVVYLTSRPIDFANKTRTFLSTLTQKTKGLPIGPILGFGGDFGKVLQMELVTKSTQKFKSAKLRQQIVHPFQRARTAAAETTPSLPNLFLAAFGNNLNDVQAYHAIGIPLSKICMIDTKSNIVTFDSYEGDSATYSSSSRGVDDNDNHGNDFPPHSWYKELMGSTFQKGYTDAKLFRHFGLEKQQTEGGKLTVYLEKATNLPNKERFGTSDPYVTLTLKNVVKEREVGKNGAGDVGQFKSEIIHNNLNPHWGETYIFENVPQIQDHQLYMSIKDDNGKILKDKMIGKCEINLWEVDGLSSTSSSDKEPIPVAKGLDEQGYLYVKISWMD